MNRLAASVRLLPARPAPPYCPIPSATGKRAPLLPPPCPTRKSGRNTGCRIRRLRNMPPRAHEILHLGLPVRGCHGRFRRFRPGSASRCAARQRDRTRASANATDEVVAVGNYLFIFKGYKPNPEELNHVVGTAPRYSQSPLPTLPKYLPAGAAAELRAVHYRSRQPGPVRAGDSAQHSGVPLQRRGRTGEIPGKQGKETTLILFNYPTMEMARDRIAHFQQIPGAIVKRSGPLVAVALNPASPDDAETASCRGSSIRRK